MGAGPVKRKHHFGDDGAGCHMVALLRAGDGFFELAVIQHGAVEHVTINESGFFI